MFAYCKVSRKAEGRISKNVKGLMMLTPQSDNNLTEIRRPIPKTKSAENLDNQIICHRDNRV